jgi:hypothetical protein
MKTVYVLGAGFSIDAGSPSQDAMVKEILKLGLSTQERDWLKQAGRFRQLLITTFNIPSKYHEKVPLEDIFTPLDRCIADNISFRNLNVEEVKKTRELVYYLIGKTLKEILAPHEKSYIDRFARYLVSECSIRKKGNYRDCDPIAVISTNWDILLDNSLKKVIETDYNNEGVVDYCCYISSFKKDDLTVKPGLEKLGMGGFNVKYLKLHGSLNWLECPRCGRVYVDFYNKLVVNQYLDKHTCRHCDTNFKQQNESGRSSHVLTSNLIMPSYLKNFNNSQYKLIWQNAGIELSEAEKIIFIGYSLPHADFEMRQLLSRMVRSDAAVEVVDWGNHELDSKLVETTDRFKTFFGTRLKKPVYYKGAKAYIEETFV